MDEPRWIGGQIGAVMLLLILLTRDEELESDERYREQRKGAVRSVQCTRDAELHLNQTGLTVIVAIAVVPGTKELMTRFRYLAYNSNRSCPPPHIFPVTFRYHKFERLSKQIPVTDLGETFPELFEISMNIDACTRHVKHHNIQMPNNATIICWSGVIPLVV
uniref:Uncharacterized protein n=1 Tax=Wuchereria bancrofti TaxID=6293 RepID=A0AAF5RVV1_WUCBA